MHNIYEINAPSNPLPLIFDSPHSGRIYPHDFGYSCSEADLERTEDTYVDDLFASAPDHGGALLKALFPRCYIDVNRAVDDVDTALLEMPWPDHLYGPIAPTARSDAGIGLIRRLVSPGVPVYNRALTAAEIQGRINSYYRPYHEALATLIDEAHYNFGSVWHINCHSMPAATARPRRAIGLTGAQPKAADFVLGDRDGTTAAKAFTHMIRDVLKTMGYTVTINDPFKGVELVRRYSAPTRGRHSLQLEINKSLYMDEDTGEKAKNYWALKADIELLIKHTGDYISHNLRCQAAD